MGFCSGCDSNPVVQILGLEHDNHLIKEVITFLFTYSIVTSVEAANQKNIFQHIVVSLVRCVGGIGFVLPLILGQMPGSMLSNFDANIHSVVYAMLFGYIAGMFMPKDIGGYVDQAAGVCVAVIRANACVAGYEAGKSAFGGSMFAPWACAYIACNGHNIAEKGLAAFGSANLDAGECLAVFGGAVYMLGQSQLGASALTARVLVVVFRLSADYVDYDEIFNNIRKSIAGSVASAAKTASAGRGRSKSPAAR